MGLFVFAQAYFVLTMGLFCAVAGPGCVVFGEVLTAFNVPAGGR